MQARVIGVRVRSVTYEYDPLQVPPQTPVPPATARGSETAGTALELGPRCTALRAPPPAHPPVPLAQQLQTLCITQQRASPAPLAPTEMMPAVCASPVLLVGTCDPIAVVVGEIVRQET
jgi:hypothetical protein